MIEKALGVLARGKSAEGAEFVCEEDGGRQPAGLLLRRCVQRWIPGQDHPAATCMALKAPTDAAKAAQQHVKVLSAVVRIVPFIPMPIFA